MQALLARYSTNQEYEPYDLLKELIERGLFRPEGSHDTPSRDLTSTVGDYLESFHSANGLPIFCSIRSRMFFSTFLTLILVPAVYVFMARFTRLTDRAEEIEAEGEVGRAEPRHAEAQS